jgi:GNAT superfamily N-acetyltransferase
MCAGTTTAHAAYLEVVNRTAYGGMTVPHVRFWQQSDLPYLSQMAAATTWNITPPDDKLHTTYERVAANAQRNLYAVLSSPHGTAVVAEDGGRPVGYLLIGIQLNDKTGEPHGYLADIYVEPAYRRQGISKALHLMGEEHLRRLGIRRVTNWTHAHNPLGQGATSHHGLNIWGLMMVKHLRPAHGAPVAAHPVAYT